MANISNCDIRDVYKTFLIRDSVGDKDCILTGAGNMFVSSIGINGTITGSISTNAIHLQGAGLENVMDLYSTSNVRLFTLNENGNAVIESLTSEPAAPTNGSGSIAFVNNCLRFYGEL